MPRIDKAYRDCILYLYKSEEDVRQAGKAGGSGFIVGVFSNDLQQRQFGLGHFYAVTNMHIIKYGNSPVIALNNTSGERQIIPKSADDWTFHAGSDDLAVCPLEDMIDYNAIAIPESIFVDNVDVISDRVGVGDEVFMVGRFMNHQGTTRNTPVVRFGNISMMPLEPVLQERPDQTQYLQDSFLVEMRSLSGFSGSPVFWYEQSVTPLPLKQSHLFLGEKVQDSSSLQMTMSTPKFLGIDWGHLNAPYNYVKQGSQLAEDQRDERTLNANSGLSGVVPAWKLTELLDHPKFVQQRSEAETKAKAEYEKSSTVRSDSVDRAIPYST